VARRREMGRGRESTTHALSDLENQAQGKCQFIPNGYLPKKLRNVIECEAVSRRTRSSRGASGNRVEVPSSAARDKVTDIKRGAKLLDGEDLQYPLRLNITAGPGRWERRPPYRAG
jgi:hypothetical protein